MPVRTVTEYPAKGSVSSATLPVVNTNNQEGGKSARKLKNAASAFLRHGLSPSNHRPSPKKLNTHNIACNLPDTIFCKIFLSCAQVDATSGWSWITLTYVCHNWRKAALFYPELWGYIDFSHPKYTAITLQRAKLVPLRIRAIVDSENIKHLKRIMQLAHRVDEINLVSSVNHIHSLLESLAHPNPALRSLSVEVCLPKEVSQGTVYPPPSFPTDGPPLASLSYLQLKGCPFYLLSTRCSSLTELHLHDIPASERPLRRHLAAILERLPKLQHLTLDRAFPVVTEDSVPDTARRVLLPHIQTVDLRGSIGEVADALDNLILPPSASLICTLCSLEDLKENVWKLSQAIGVHSWAAAEVMPLETLIITGKEISDRYISPKEINPDFCQSMRIRAYRTDSDSSNIAFDFTIGSDSLPCTDEVMIIALGAVWRALALAHIHTLVLQNLDIVTQKSWSQLLRTLPSLRVLDIAGHPPSGVVWALLLNAVAHAQGDAEGQRLLIPRLDDIYLHGVDCSRGGFMVSSSIPVYSHADLDDSRFLDVLSASVKERIRFGTRIRSLSISQCEYVLQRVVDNTRKFVSNVVWDGRGTIKEKDMDAFSPARYRFQWTGDRTEPRHYFRLPTLLKS